MKRLLFLISLLMFLIPSNAGNKGIQQTIKRIDGKRYIVEPADSDAFTQRI